MAESTTPPSLPSTADATPYVPVAWLAVVAISVAGAFAVTLLALAVAAFTNKKPLLEDWLLALPAITIVLSFAARRVIRNSEGTRAGENLAVYAWWIALVLGLCYVAYLFAIDFAIRRDARGEATRWVDLIAKGTDDDLIRAFLRALPPGARQGVSPDDKYQIQARFRDELLIFRHCDLVKLAVRNKGEFEFTAGGVTWTPRPGAVECVLNGTVKCPEGTFPMTINLRGADATAEGGGGGRQWMISRPGAAGFFDQARVTRTDYGWWVFFLELDGDAFGRAFVSHLAPGPTSHLPAYRAFVAPGGDRPGWGAVAAERDPRTTLITQLMFAVPARAAFGDSGFAEYMDTQFFKLPGGAEPTSEQKKRFFASWNVLGLRPAGDKLRDGAGNIIDKEGTITVTDTAIEVRVPVEIPVLGTGRVEAARGRVVVACTDPAVLAELKALRASANPAQGTASPPEELKSKRIPWRVVRVESDMVPVNATQRGPGGPGGEFGPPG
jgi:hypothetical protein